MAGPQQLDVGHLLAHVPHGDRHLILALERDVAHEHLVEHDPERVEIAGRADALAERLLGADVVGGAEHAPVGGEAVLLEGARDAEVGHLRAAVLVDQHVLRLDVAVHDALVVGGLQRAGDLDRVGERLGHVEPAQAADARLERLAGDVLEHDERRATILADVDHLHDVRVVELGDGARLAPEPLELGGVAGHGPQHRLDRNGALEHLVERRQTVLIPPAPTCASSR